MKYIIALVFLGFVAATYGQSTEKPLPLENIDVDNTLKNQKLVNKYVDCVLGRGRCDRNGHDLKEMIPRVINEDCRGCSPKQTNNAYKIIDYMKKNRAAEWDEINRKYSTRS